LVSNQELGGRFSRNRSCAFRLVCRLEFGVSCRACKKAVSCSGFVTDGEHDSLLGQLSDKEVEGMRTWQMYLKEQELDSSVNGVF
jgi:hypothetical protein